MSHHRLALITVALATLTAAGLGWLYSAVTPGFPVWHGVFCGFANSVTDGCDVAPRTAAGYWVEAAEYCAGVPLFAAALAFFTSGLLAGHIRKHFGSGGGDS